jgi:CHAT domain-containing protein
MIAIAVTPRRLVAGQRTQLSLRFSNPSPGPYRKIVFTLAVQPGLRLIGTERIDIASIEPGAEVVRSVTVEAARAGEFTLTSPNFSYRDEDDESLRDRRWQTVLIAAEPERRHDPAPVLVPPPRLRVEHEGGALPLGRWTPLPILVQNPSGTTVSEMLVTIISGPVETDRKPRRISVLPSGKKARLNVDVHPRDGGLVPLTVRLTYSYADGTGALRRAAQEEQLRVPVGDDGQRDAPPAASAQGTQPGRPARTVLFLSSSPRDQPTLHPDEELRLIEQELLMSEHRHEFRLVPQAAVRLTDISRALARHRPQIVHFSGHGDDRGRILVGDPLGNSMPLENDGLVDIFAAYNDTIQCVIVNACHSARLARAISAEIHQVIGMRYQIADDTAAQFSVGFYQAIFSGATVERAFKVAPALLRSDAATAMEYETPTMFTRNPS